MEDPLHQSNNVSGDATLLRFLEYIGIVAFIILIGVLVYQKQSTDMLQPLSVEALQAQPGNERWNGIFFQDQHVGFSVNRTSTLTDGTVLMEQRSMLKLVTFGQLQTIITAGAALTSPSGSLLRFDFVMNSEAAKLSVKGEVHEKQILMEVDQGTGEISTLDFPIDKPPHVALSLETQIRNTELAVGKELKVPYFDPASMSEGEMRITVVESVVLDTGEEAWWLVSEFNGVQTRSLVSSAGDILRQEAALGISMVRMTPTEAQQLDLEEPVDLIGLSAVKLEGKIKNAREKTDLEVYLKGVDSAKLISTPPVQMVGENNLVTIHIPDANTFAQIPIESSNTKDLAYLESTIDIPAEHPEIRGKTTELLQGITDRWSAVLRLEEFVFDYMDKVPVIGVPNGLSALQQAKGDCNEHTALFVSLARAAKIPTRIAAGIVFSDRSGPIGQFYYHAWPEVYMQLSTGEWIWVPIDPTFGQAPADATHIKLVEGGLDRQVEIMAFLGHITVQTAEDANK